LQFGILTIRVMYDVLYRYKIGDVRTDFSARYCASKLLKVSGQQKWSLIVKGGLCFL